MMERETKVTPAWDSGTREKGRHCCDLLFILRGDKGVLLFEVYTGWYLGLGQNYASSPSKVAYHGYQPVHGEDVPNWECELLGGKPCYSGSCCCGREMFQVLVEGGTEGLWEEMEKLYVELFETERDWFIGDYDNMAKSVAG